MFVSRKRFDRVTERQQSRISALEHQLESLGRGLYENRVYNPGFSGRFTTQYVDEKAPVNLGALDESLSNLKAELRKKRVIDQGGLSGILTFGIDGSVSTSAFKAISLVDLQAKINLVLAHLGIDVCYQKGDRWVLCEREEDQDNDNG